MGIVGICGVALVGGIAALVLTGVGAKFSFAAKLCTVIVIVAFVALFSRDMLAELFSLVDGLGDAAGYYELVLKALGVALIAQLTSGICRELGAESVAGTVEGAARLEIFVLCLPVVAEILGYASELFAIS